MTKNNTNSGNGFTVKDMLGMVMDNQEKANNKWSSEFKRLYDKMDTSVKELEKHDAEQDKKIEKMDTKLGIIWKTATGAISLVAAALVGLFFKK